MASFLYRPPDHAAMRGEAVRRHAVWSGHAGGWVVWLGLGVWLVGGWGGVGGGEDGVEGGDVALEGGSALCGELGADVASVGSVDGDVAGLLEC